MQVFEYPPKQSCNFLINGILQTLLNSLSKLEGILVRTLPDRTAVIMSLDKNDDEEIRTEQDGLIRGLSLWGLIG